MFKVFEAHNNDVRQRSFFFANRFSQRETVPPSGGGADVLKALLSSMVVSLQNTVKYNIKRDYVL